MVIAVRTEEADGGLVVVKEARSDGDVARLGREATMLARSRHPGVVDLLDVGERSIRLRHAGTALGRLGPFPLDQAAGIVCAIADVVHAMHRLGVVHGDIEASHVLLDDRGRPRLCGFGLADEHTAAGAADDVAALGRLLSSLLRAGSDLPWARPPTGLRRSARQRQARRELDAIAAQAVRERREQRPSARQLAKAIHAAVPECSLPVPGSSERGPAPRFTDIPSDIDPTADLGWTDDDLSWLASAADDDDDGEDTPESAGPYAGLGALGTVSMDDAPDDWAELAANPEAVTGPLPIVEPTERPRERPRIEHVAPPPPPSALPGVSLPPRTTLEDPARRRLPLVGVAVVVAALALGVVGGVAGARALRPLGSDPVAGVERAGTSTTSTTVDEPTTTSTTAPAGASSAVAGAAWPDTCEIPEPTGPDVDGDGCPEGIELDGRTARIGTVTVQLGDEGDLVVLGDWDCDGIDTPALLRPATGEVFVFSQWRLDEPVEVEAAATVPDATDIDAGSGECPSPVVDAPVGATVIEVSG